MITTYFTYLLRTPLCIVNLINNTLIVYFLNNLIMSNVLTMPNNVYLSALKHPDTVHYQINSKKLYHQLYVKFNMVTQKSFFQKKVPFYRCLVASVPYYRYMLRRNGHKLNSLVNSWLSMLLRHKKKEKRLLVTGNIELPWNVFSIGINKSPLARTI